jgi:hypothetical protein
LSYTSGFIVEVDDFSAVGVFTPPDLTLNTPLTSDLTFSGAFVDRGSFYGKKYLKDINYYYLFSWEKILRCREEKGRRVFKLYKKKCDD